MYKSTAIACLAALAAAAPAPNAGVTAYNANFDDLGVSEAAITPIGPYDGLNYEGIGSYDNPNSINRANTT